FADLSGRAWLVYGAPIVAHGLALLAFVEYVQWSSGQVGTEIGSSAVPAAVPWLIGVAVMFKLLGAGWGLRAARQAMASARQLAALAALWEIVALCLFAAISWIASQGALS